MPANIRTTTRQQALESGQAKEGTVLLRPAGPGKLVTQQGNGTGRHHSSHTLFRSKAALLVPPARLSMSKPQERPRLLLIKADALVQNPSHFSVSLAFLYLLNNCIL